jgi:hypothetical protein
VNAAVFLDYINSIFIPCLKESRDSAGFDPRKVVLLIDNCSPHMCDDIIAVLVNAHVKVITFASHKTHVFQMLDVMPFGALEKHTIGLEILNEKSGTIAFIRKLYHDLKQTMVELKIQEPFQPLD